MQRADWAAAGDLHQITDPARLASLRALALLDAPPIERLDRVTRLTSSILKAPVSLITLVDADRQFFASAAGLPEPWASRRQTPLSYSFCQHVVTDGTPLVIADARVHPRVHENLAVRDLGVVAYAGVPLTLPNGATVGSLCAIDRVSRVWTADELQTLEDLAASVMSEIELRAAAAEARQGGARGATARLGAER